MENFEDTWTFWNHINKEGWTIKSFKELLKINSAENFWSFFNNLDKLNNIFSKHLFLMLNDTKPIWEDEMNRNGGCWSFKVNDKNYMNLFKKLSILLVTKEISNDKNDIVGISICPKKNNFFVIKIWNKDSNKCSLSLLNKKILEEWGTEIIYIAHMLDT
jgi:translation initiation factor 4E